MRRSAIAVRILAVAALVMGAGTACAQSKREATAGGAQTLQFWTRANSEAFDKKLVDAWNASHTPKVALNVIPNDLFVTKFGSAAGSGNAPDVAAVDVVYLPQFNKTGQLSDLTDRINALPYKDKLVSAHVRLGTYENRQYAVPHNVDGSVLLYNKDLFKAAGLDPEKPPTTWDGIYQAAKKITNAQKSASGFYFAGNCTGCNAYTMLPMVWASGKDLLSEDGTQATVPSQEFGDLLALYKKMWQEKLVPVGAKTDNGSSWQSTFMGGKIGMVALGTFAIPGLKDQKKFEWGLAPLPGRDGGRSTFVGGDAIGIPKGSKKADDAWKFIEWTLSDEAQVEIIAKSGVLTARTDLTNNKYTTADPRVKLNNDLLAEGRTPMALPYNAMFNDPNGPWLAMLRKAIFDNQTPQAAMDAGQEQFSRILKAG